MGNILTVITPVGRYLGFSAPVAPVDQFSAAVAKVNIPGLNIRFVDPQRAQIRMSKDMRPVVYDQDDNPLTGGVYFAFGHDLLDRRMASYMIRALEIAGEKVINGYEALTFGDDKAHLALQLANKGIPVAKSVITSARSNSEHVIGYLDSPVILSKTSGFSAGGVGVKPIVSEINFLAPDLWSSRMDSKPKIIQNDLDPDKSLRQVVRTYIVGGKVIGSYTTTGYGIVNCAGLARESVAERYDLKPEQERALLSAASLVGASGYCRVDSVGGENFSIIEINPLARMDADSYGIDVAEALIRYAIKMDGQDV